MNIEKFYLFTSNKDKLKEMRQFLKKLSSNLIIKNINKFDLPEPQKPAIINKKLSINNKVIVGIYKSFLVNELLKKGILDIKKLKENEYILLEDTILEDISGKEVLDIKFWIKEGKLNNINRVKWITTFIKLNNNEEISIYNGEVKGKIVKEPRGNGFGFDNYFVPEGEFFTLGEKKPEKYNARFLSLKNLIENKIIYKYSLQNFRKDFDLNNTIWQNNYSLKDFIQKYKINIDKFDILEKKENRILLNY